MIKQHLHFKLPTNLDVPIIRYFKIARFIEMIEKQAIYFPRSDKLGDRFEGSYTRKTLEHRPNFFKGAKEQFINETIPETNKMWRELTYISCWNTNIHESADMWGIYSSKTEGVAIRSSTKRIMHDGILDPSPFLLGFVKYIDFDDDYISEANSFIPFFHKRIEYKSEKEFRIIKENVEKIGELSVKNYTPPNGLWISINLKVLIEQIITSPEMNTNQLKKLKEILKNKKLNNLLTKSKLSSIPTY